MLFHKMNTLVWSTLVVLADDVENFGMAVPHLNARNNISIWEKNSSVQV